MYKYAKKNMIFFRGNGLIIFPLFLMGKIRLVYVLFGISLMIWNGLRTYTEVPLYIDHFAMSNFVSSSMVSNVWRFSKHLEVTITSYISVEIHDIL